jgi:hypothetical protein
MDAVQSAVLTLGYSTHVRMNAFEKIFDNIMAALLKETSESYEQSRITSKLAKITNVKRKLLEEALIVETTSVDDQPYFKKLTENQKSLYTVLSYTNLKATKL